MFSILNSYHQSFDRTDSSANDDEQQGSTDCESFHFSGVHNAELTKHFFMYPFVTNFIDQ